MPKGSIEWEWDPEDGLTLHIRPMLRELVSDEARAHVKTSRKEMLLAFRDLLDAAARKMDEKEKSQGRGRTKIKVE